MRGRQIRIYLKACIGSCSVAAEKLMMLMMMQQYPAALLHRLQTRLNFRQPKNCNLVVINSCFFRAINATNSELEANQSSAQDAKKIT
jgi:hypothetical protein